MLGLLDPLREKDDMVCFSSNGLRKASVDGKEMIEMGG